MQLLPVKGDCGTHAGGGVTRWNGTGKASYNMHLSPERSHRSQVLKGSQKQHILNPYIPPSRYIIYSSSHLLIYSPAHPHTHTPIHLLTYSPTHLREVSACLTHPYLIRIELHDTYPPWSPLSPPPPPQIPNHETAQD